MKKEIKIPEISENVDKGQIAGILVSEGDSVKTDQSLVEIETDKATTDLPSPYDGVIEEIKVAEGDEVSVGQVIIILNTEEEKEDETQKEKDEQDNEKEKPEQEEEGKKEESDKSEKESGEGKKESEDAENTDGEEEEKAKEKSSEDKSDKNKLSDIPASPSVRRLARELRIDLSQVKGSGPGERLTADDIKNHSQKPALTGNTIQLPDFSKWGSTSSEDMTSIRKITAQNVQQSWQTIPHVTQFDEADMTNLEEFRKNSQERMEREGGKLTITAILLKIVGFALQKFPRFNASIDEQNNKIIYKHYFNIGVAADTPQGLLVPVVHDVNTKPLTKLSVELTELAQKARDKKLSSDEMQGGNFTISNLGGIGGTGFTPIVLPPQVAILGVSKARYQQVFIDGEFRKRLIIPLSLSYDHRIIDGADGARFLRWICDVIEDPYALLQ